MIIKNKSFWTKSLVLSALSISLVSCINPDLFKDLNQDSNNNIQNPGLVTIATDSSLTSKDLAYLQLLSNDKFSDEQLMSDLNTQTNNFVKNEIIIKLANSLYIQNKYEAATYYLMQFTPSANENQQNQFNLLAVQVGEKTNNLTLINLGSKLDPNNLKINQKLNGTIASLNISIRNGQYDEGLDQVNSIYKTLNAQDKQTLVNSTLESLTNSLNINRLQNLENIAKEKQDHINAGWYKLAGNTVEHASEPNELALSWEEWLKEYSAYNHPASKTIPDLFKESKNASQVNFDTVSVLIPLSISGYANYAKALQAGIEQANQDTGNRTKITYIDTANSPIEQSYLEAKKQGKIIIGPLLPNNVNTLSGQSLDHPEIMLNNTGSYSTSTCYLTMIIEDEAETIAKAMIALGIENPVIFSDNSTSSNRATDTFNNLWLNEKQENVKVETYNEEDLSIKVRTALRSTPQPQAFFFQGNTSALIDFVNDLNYYKPGNNYKVFTTSKANSIRLDRGKLIDLKNVYFTDSELLGSQSSPKSRTATKTLQSSDYNFIRLYGMGYDAFTIAQQYGAFKGIPNFNLKGVNGIYSTKAGEHCILKTTPSIYEVQNGSFVKIR